jgi:hypothetical protein
MLVSWLSRIRNGVIFDYIHIEFVGEEVLRPHPQKWS